MSYVKIVMGVVLLSAAWGCEQLAGGTGGAGEGAAAQQGPAGPAPVICDVPQCGSRALSVARSTGTLAPAKRMESSSPAESRAMIEAAFRRGDPGARYLAAWAAKTRRASTATGERSLRTPPAGPNARWLAAALDEIVPGWESLAGDAPAGSSGALAVETSRFALETSGCGAMSLRMRLRSVTVIEREDNFARDNIYCVFQSAARDRLEVLQTEVVGPLDAGETAPFEDGVYFGREGTRDPGQEVDLSYTCFEQDGPAEYERIRGTLGEILDVAERFAKEVNPKWQAYVVSIRRAIDLITRIAQVLDGDDQLYYAEERLDRRALWALIVEGERRLEMGGTNNTSDWSWRLALDYDGCEGQPQVDEGGAPQGGGEVVPEGCGPQSCDGCCVGDRCAAGDTSDRCGRGGAACGSCATLEGCQRGECAFDEERRFDVKVLRAEIAAGKANGDCWDFGCGEPDVFVTLRAAGQSERTSLQRSFNPQWDATVLTGVPARALMDAMEVVVTDDDVNLDDLIGRCNPSFSRSELAQGRAAVDCGQARVFLGFIPR